MRGVTAFFAAAALTLMVETAKAEGISGAIEEIDPEANTIVVGGTVFTVASGTVGPKLDELKQGDTVEVVFSPKSVTEDTFNALMIRRKE
jgi:Domain of unknown function (DUF5666)